MTKLILKTAFLGIIFVFVASQPSYALCRWSGWLWTCDAFNQVGQVTVAQAPASTELPVRSENNASCILDPVFLSNGQFSYECVDIAIPGRKMDIDLKHAYFSGLALNGQFGYGWNLSEHMVLHELTNNNVVIVSDGRKTQYTLSGAIYTPPAGRFEKLEKNPDTTFKLTLPEGKVYNFNSNGSLGSIFDRNGNQITFTYNPAGLVPILGHSSFSQNAGEHLVIGYDYQLTQITDTVGRIITLAYDNDGKLSTITDYAGRIVRFGYDSNTDDLLTITKPATQQFPNGVTKTFTYDANHNATTITDARGQTFVTNHYDAQGRVFQQDLGTGHSSFNYAVANQTTVTDRKGFVTKYTFNATGNVVSKEEFTAAIHSGDPASFVTNYIYNTDMLLTSLIYPKGNGIKYVYDSSNTDARKHGNLLQLRRKTDMTAADNDTNDLVTLMTYDASFNQIKTATDPKGNVTTNTYDYELPTSNPHYGTKGDLIYVDQPQVGNQTPRLEMTYNAYGQPTEVKDPNNNITQYEYFPTTGYLNKIKKDPSGINAITQMTYDQFGYPDLVTDANNHTTDYDYNELGWLLQEKNPLNRLTKYTHDENGNVIKVEKQTNAAGNQWQTTQMTYDLLNHLQTVTDPLHRVTSYTYDNNENKHTMLDAENHTTTYDYDERNKLFKTTDANSGVTQNDYDLNGNLAKITDANSHATNYAFDLFDRKSTETYADGKFYTYAYDKNSNVLQLIKPSTAPNPTISYTYDALNRLTTKTYPTTNLNASFTYDLGSRLTDANTAASQNHFIYDNLNRPVTNTQTINAQAYNLTYSYDKTGNRSQLNYPSGKKISYGYDANDNMVDLKTGDGFATSYKYDILDRRQSKTYNLSPNPTVSGYSYDIANELTDVATKGPSGLVADYSYGQYDRVGNRKTVKWIQGPTTASASTMNYNYDNIYQLTNVTGAQTHNYTYDQVANRLTVDGTNYTPNTVNQYTTVGSTNYNYDLNGNLTFDGNNTYTYDEENRLNTVQKPSMSAQYAYDAFNRRVSKTVNGTATYFINDGDREVEERDTAGSLSAVYVYGASIDEVLSMTKGANTYYYHYDGLGSVTELTNAAGAIVESYTYDPYGMPSLTASAVGNPFRFTGRRFDEESGIYNYRNRMYSPMIGRFLQNDPVGYLDSMNLYQYTDSVGEPLLSNPSDFTNAYNFVGNNPVNYIDPLGLYKYSTTNVGIAFLHESNPFNTDGAFFQQATSIGSFFGGDLAGAAATSGQSIVEQTNTPCTDSGWQKAYTGAQITAGIAALTAGSLIAVEAGTAIRIEAHGTHGGRALPHLQGIKGPGWGKTLWRFPPH